MIAGAAVASGAPATAKARSTVNYTVAIKDRPNGYLEWYDFDSHTRNFLARRPFIDPKETRSRVVAFRVPVNFLEVAPCGYGRACDLIKREVIAQANYGAGFVVHAGEQIPYQSMPEWLHKALLT